MADYYPISRKTRETGILPVEPFSSTPKTVEPVQNIPEDPRKTLTQKPRKKSTAKQRENDALKAINDPTDSDRNIESYLKENKGEVFEQYLTRWKLSARQIMPRGIGPARSQNISNVLMNELKYGCKYSDYTDDVIDKIFERPLSEYPISQSSQGSEVQQSSLPPQVQQVQQVQEIDEEMISPVVVCLKRQGGQIVQDSDIYIGRKLTQGGWNLPESMWANPYKVGKDGTLEEVIEKYEEYARNNPEIIENLDLLSGKTLGCWCKGKKGREMCHGDVLVKLFNEAFM